MRPPTALERQGARPPAVKIATFGFWLILTRSLREAHQKASPRASGAENCRRRSASGLGWKETLGPRLRLDRPHLLATTRSHSAALCPARRLAGRRARAVGSTGHAGCGP